jgi:hypothetical protein
MFAGKEFFLNQKTSWAFRLPLEKPAGQQRTLQNEISSFLGRTILACLDPDSGSTNSFESGSNQDPDPKHDHGSSLGIGSSASSLRQYEVSTHRQECTSHYLTSLPPSTTSLPLIPLYYSFFSLTMQLRLAYVRASKGLKLCLLL